MDAYHLKALNPPARGRPRGVRAHYCSVIPAGRDWRQAYTRGARVARLVSGPVRPSNSYSLSRIRWNSTL